MQKYYRALKLEPGASMEEVKQAYREQVKVWHPDKYPEHLEHLQLKAHKKFREINDAFEKIKTHKESLNSARFTQDQPFEDGFRTGKASDDYPDFGSFDEADETDSGYSSENNPSFEASESTVSFYKRKWPNGDRYEGQAFNNRMHGMGIFTSAVGDRYTGQFRFGVPDGNGKMVYANGDVYEGEFVADRMTGRGTYRYNNGDKFIGYFKDDTPHGPGAFIMADGTSHSGNWEYGALLNY
ncbi:MAG: DnaJ domain-containing protein [Nitrospinota bacterium]|nr:DnaJ domain-containing protein [Nitrospinota bacterium]